MRRTGQAMKQQPDATHTTIIDETESNRLAIRVNSREKNFAGVSHNNARSKASPVLPIVHRLLLDERDGDAARIYDRELRRAPRCLAERAIGMDDACGA